MGKQLQLCVATGIRETREFDLFVSSYSFEALVPGVFVNLFL